MRFSANVNENGERVIRTWAIDKTVNGEHYIYEVDEFGRKDSGTTVVSQSDRSLLMNEEELGQLLLLDHGLRTTNALPSTEIDRKVFSQCSHENIFFRTPDDFQLQPNQSSGFVAHFSFAPSESIASKLATSECIGVCFYRGISHEALDQLSKIHTLEYVQIQRSVVTWESILRLGEISSLRRLEIHHTSITEGEYVQGPSDVSPQINMLIFKDVAFANLKLMAEWIGIMKDLQWLEVPGTQFSCIHFQLLPDSLRRKLVFLNFERCPIEAGIISLVEGRNVVVNLRYTHISEKTLRDVVSSSRIQCIHALGVTIPLFVLGEILLHDQRNQILA